MDADFHGQSLNILLPSYQEYAVSTLSEGQEPDAYSLCALQWSAETNARITALFFKWLVGPLETKDVEVDFDGRKQTWNSGVQIKKCRYCLTSTWCTKSSCGVPVPQGPRPTLAFSPAGIWSKVDAWACASTCARCACKAPLLQYYAKAIGAAVEISLHYIASVQNDMHLCCWRRFPRRTSSQISLGCLSQ